MVDDRGLGRHLRPGEPEGAAVEVGVLAIHHEGGVEAAKALP